MNEINEVSQDFLAECYVSAINSLFNNTVTATKEQITEEVMKLVDTMISEIVEKSRAFEALDFRQIYVAVATNAVGEILQALIKNQFLVERGKSVFKEWLDSLWRKRQYQAVINTVRLKYRSPITLALMGL